MHKRLPDYAGRTCPILWVEVPNGEKQRDLQNGCRRAQNNPGEKPMIKMRAGAAPAILSIAMCAGCAATSTLGPFPSGGAEKVVQQAADVLIDGVNYTRESGREVAGWCWNDKATDRLASVVQAGAGGYEEVGIALPLDPRGTGYVSCTWHTHAWDANVVPGPSKNDLRNSSLPWVSGITHFVLDGHGIWQYAQGRVIEMCPWNSAGTNFDPTRCRSGFDSPTNSYSRVVRFYSRRDSQP